jgi:ASC-1-like (ASCH) protein
MTKHEMKLQPQPFEKIRQGTKKIELRLYDEKRRGIEIGDEITFLKEPEQTESIKVRVVGLLKYASFADLAKDFDTQTYFGFDSTEELLQGVSKFFSEEEQKRYGVLGIRLSPPLD